MKANSQHVLSINPTSEIRRVTCGGPGEPIVFHLTPLGKKNYRLFDKRWNAEQARIRRENARNERNAMRELTRDLNRSKRQEAVLFRSLKKGEIPRGIHHKCAACGKTSSCRKYRDEWFCVDCLKMDKNKEIEVICPRHKEWCGGKYGSCAGCLGESYGSALPY